ncbi:MAG: nuclear transport factor 2 family protein, partial [Bacteroidota bacterium]
DSLSTPNINQEILSMDSLLFNVAFNQCNLELFKSIMSDEIEFYDDRTGLNTSIEKEIASFKDKCAKPFDVTRRLLSSHASILGDYGAVQIGEHEFDVNDVKSQKAKFITIWERTNNSWIVKRAISYEHQDLETSN